MLLHIGNAAARWTTVNPEVLFLGILAFVVVTAVIWCRPLSFRRLARVLGPPTMSVFVAFAVLPSVIPYDHLIAPSSAHAAEEEASEVHASHCHIAPGSCADAPLASGLGQFLSSDPLVVTPVLTALAIMLSTPVLAGISTRPLIRPPLAAT